MEVDEYVRKMNDRNRTLCIYLDALINDIFEQTGKEKMTFLEMARQFDKRYSIYIRPQMLETLVGAYERENGRTILVRDDFYPPGLRLAPRSDEES